MKCSQAGSLALTPWLRGSPVPLAPFHTHQALHDKVGEGEFDPQSTKHLQVPVHGQLLSALLPGERMSCSKCLFSEQGRAYGYIMWPWQGSG